MAAQFYKINYKSDFVLTINSDAGWAVPFCIKFWTGMPSHGYFAGFDGENYVNCRVGETPTQLLVMFDDHHMPVGPLRMQIAYHTTIEEFPDRKFDEVTNPTNVTVDIDGTEYQVMLDFTGETGAEIDFSMPSSGVMSVNGKIGYVTLTAEDVGAQPTIEDLATIRSGAAEGATAVQPAEMTAALATKQDTIPDLATIRSGAAAGSTAVQPAELQQGLATKQNVISDLATIRSGAAAGATAYQKPGTGIPESDLASGVQSSLHKADAAAPQSNTYTKGEVDTLIAGAGSDIDVDDALSTTSENPVQNKVLTTALNGKQDVISDLSTIRSGAAAGATAVQPAALQEGLAGKQDTISDLATIRSGAAAGATAVQPAALTPIENDIDAIEGKIPSAASASNQLADKAFVNSALSGKADTSDIPTALSQLSQDSTHRVVTDAEKSTWNGKQNSIDDLATIRSGAAAGATAVQPAAMNTALAAKQDTLTFDNTPTANSSNPVKSSGIKTALDAKQSTISTVNVTVDNNTGTPSGSASVSGSTLSLSFQNLKGATGATGATGPQGPQGERGLPGESGVTGDVSGFTVIQTIDPSATYGATDIAGAATVQATNEELAELAGEANELSEGVFGIEKTLTSTDFTQGSLDPTDASELVRDTRIRTGYIKVSQGSSISIILNGQQYVIYYFDEEKVYDYSTSWSLNDANITISHDGYIRVLIAKSDNAAITTSELLASIVINIKGISQEIEDIDNTIQGALYNEYSLSSSDFVQGSISSGEIVTPPSPYRIRTGSFISVLQGEKLTIVPNEQMYNVVYYSQDGTYIESTGWVGTSRSITFEQNYLIKLLVKIDDRTQITPSQLSVQFTFSRFIINELQEDITELQNNYTKIENTLSNKLFLGTLVQKGLSATGLTDSTTRVSMQSCLTVPFVEATLRFSLPEHYFVGIRSGNQANNLNNNDYWYKDGDTYTFRNDVRYFRLCFAYSSVDPPTTSTYADITVATVRRLIDSGDIAISIYEPNELSLFERNSASEKYAKAIMRPFVSGASNNYSLKKLPIFLHTSDIHGDAKRFENFMDYADYLEVDAALISGDMVAYNTSNSKVFVDDIASLHSTADLQCLGNHDSSGATIQAEGEMLASCIQRNSCVVNSNEQYPTYYYKDISEKNIRVIALNLYSVQGTGDTWRFSQAQCEWFIATLASTPANYGVIVMMHSPEVIPPIDEQYGKFRQTILNYTNTGALAARPLANIIDAFIGKESKTITYTSHSTNISVSADFTSVNSGVEFIAYVNGHLHTDTIGFVPDTTHRQLVLNVCCGIGIYGTTYPYLANNSDLPRDGKGATQDSFNLYAIDRSSGTVRVAKIGSNTTGNMETRDWMIIPYAG